MGIFSRFRDIVNANVNAILDRAEDPEKMVRLMIQEMEDTLIEVKATCAGLIAEQKRLERTLNTAMGEVEEWANKAELAVDKGREDLARAALAEKHRIQKRVDSLTEETTHSRQLVSETQADIAQLESKLNDARERQRLLIQRQTAAINRIQAQTQIRRAETSDAFIKFETYENNIDRLEAESRLVDGLRPKNGDLRNHFAQLEQDDAIQRELEDIKRRKAESNQQ